MKDGGLTHSGRLLRNPQAGGMWEAKAKFCYSSVRDDDELKPMRKGSGLFGSVASAFSVDLLSLYANW